MEEISAKTQMAKIRNFEKGFIATHLVNLGARLGIFEALNENKDGLTLPVLAANLGVYEPYLKIWCQTAYHFEILDSDENGRFILQPYLDEILGDKNHFRNYLANIAMDVDLIDDFRNPTYNYGILDQFYEICADSVHLTVEDQNDLLTAAGFKDIQRRPIGRGMFDFITATK